MTSHHRPSIPARTIANINGMATTRSIFDYLTAPNPRIQYYEGNSRSLTTSIKYHVPKQLIHWDEFNFRTLETVYNKSLIQEARHKRCSLEAYPHILPEWDCQVGDEATTIAMLTKWNHTIVTQALEDVRQSFNPCFWVQGSGKSKVKADAGAISSSLGHGSTTTAKEKQMLPKDYKTANKWMSSAVFEKGLIDQKTGLWGATASKKPEAMPIRQAYTYCIKHQCRYGCILSTGEAFIFRIRPRAVPSGMNISEP